MSEPIPPQDAPAAPPLAAPAAVEKAGVTALLGHADRLWKAAEANATRLNANSTLLVSTVTAIIGFKLFTLGNQLDTLWKSAGSGLAVVVWITGIVSIFCMVIALGLVLRLIPTMKAKTPAGQVKPEAAMDLMNLPETESTAPWTLTDQQAVWSVFLRTYSAATNLQARNAVRQVSLDKASKWLRWGLVFLAISMVGYARVSYNVFKKETALNVHPNLLNPNGGDPGHGEWSRPRPSEPEPRENAYPHSDSAG